MENCYREGGGLECDLLRSLLQSSGSFVIVLSLAASNALMQMQRGVEGAVELESTGNKRVDEMHETPDNLASLLLTNTTICRQSGKAFKGGIL
jgi:hypothetical protein